MKTRIGRELNSRDQEESTRLTANHLSYFMMNGLIMCLRRFPTNIEILGFEGRKKAVFNFRELDFFYDNATILNVNGKLFVLLNFLTNT